MVTDTGLGSVALLTELQNLDLSRTVVSDRA